MCDEVPELIDEVAVKERRLAALRDRLDDYRRALEDARAAFLHADYVASLRSRWTIDWPFVVGLALSPGVSAAILVVGDRVLW